MTDNAKPTRPLLISLLVLAALLVTAIVLAPEPAAALQDGCRKLPIAQPGTPGCKPILM